MTWRPVPKKDYKQRSAEVTSSMMSKIRSRNNKTEVALRKALWRKGYRYRLYKKGLPGKPDLVFARDRIAVFVDGDFWHGRTLVEEGHKGLLLRVRSPNATYWVEKLSKNVARDSSATAELERMGWSVLRFWESDVARNIEKTVNTISAILDQKRKGDHAQSASGRKRGAVRSSVNSL